MLSQYAVIYSIFDWCDRVAYRFYNPNPSNKFVDDCVIRAISKITGDEWESIYIDLSLAGLKEYNMPSVNSVWGNYLRSRGYTRNIIPNTCPDCYTVRDFCIEHPIGKYILATGSHVIAVIDGDYFDTADTGNEVPIFYWRKDTRYGD